MNNILHIAGSACFAVVFVASGIPFKVKRWLGRNRLKPFDCVFCLAWWGSIATGLFFGKNGLETIYVSSISAVLAVILEKKLNK